jgi:hypothetical protein
MDKSQPSTNAMSASNLFRLGTLLLATQEGGGEEATKGEAYLLQARETVNAFEAEILQYPWLFVSLLTGVVTARLGVKKVEVARGDAEGLRRWYTAPRAEAGVLVLVEDGGNGEGKGVADAKGPDEPKEAGLEKGVEGLRIGERS